MKFIFIKHRRSFAKKTASDYKRELLIKQAAEQFKALAKKGLRVPVAFL